MNNNKIVNLYGSLEEINTTKTIILTKTVNILTRKFQTLLTIKQKFIKFLIIMKTKNSYSNEIKNQFRNRFKYKL